MRGASVGPVGPSELPAIAEIARVGSRDGSARTLVQVEDPTRAALHEDDYRAALEAGEILVACRLGGRVLGFLHACDLSHLAEDAVLGLAVSEVEDPAYFIRRIAVHPDHSADVAGLLYDHFTELVEPLPVLAGVLADPPDIRSIQHHHAHGFGVRGRYVGADGRSRLLFVNPGTLRSDVTDRSDLI